MGVKNIVSYLNRNRIFTRDGGRWGIGQVHRILTRRTYIGEHEFNKRFKTKERKPVGEAVAVPVPPIIDRETFEAVQGLLKARNPKVMPARVVSGPTMLTGLIHCARCGGAMTIRTGKGGRYRYYACSTKARQGPTACQGMAVPMEKLDDLVAEHLEKRLLDPERLETILAAVLDRRQERADRRREHIAELNKRAAESELRLKRLYDAIEAGVADLDDPALKRPHRRAEGHPRSGESQRRPCPGRSPELGAAGRNVTDVGQVRPSRASAYPARRGRISPRPSPGARPACGGRCRRRPDYGIEEPAAPDPPGGRGGIRTHGTLAGTPVFKTGAFNHSATRPSVGCLRLAGQLPWRKTESLLLSYRRHLVRASRAKRTEAHPWLYAPSTAYRGKWRC
jgi:hypothetical protein